MNISFELKDPDKLEAELTLRMTVGDFKQLKEAIGTKWPGWKVSHAIHDLIARAEQTFNVEIKPDEK